MPAKTESKQRMPENTESTRTQPINTNRCPVCFGNNVACTHGSIITSKTQRKFFFIGFYNRKVYNYNTIPAIELEEYEKFIYERVLKFSNLLTCGQKSGICYRGLLLEKFYEPIASHAKDKGYITEDAFLSIKQEKKEKKEKQQKHSSLLNNQQSKLNAKNDMSDDDNVSIDLGAHLNDDNQQIPKYSSTNNNIQQQKRKSLSLSISSSSLIPRKTNKIKKASPRKDKLHKKQITNTILLKNTTKGCQNTMLLNERDFKDLPSFHLALRRELNRPCSFQFKNLQYKHPEIESRVDVMNVISKY